MPLRMEQADDRVPQGMPPAAEEKKAAAAAELPDDLDQRVRQVGEWQLEDW
ncbi:MAG: hypothetical protein HY854_07830 [Burkholderiales bacterium]|nr:hypothetical protein [Burkholderiales bacterium]